MSVCVSIDDQVAISTRARVPFLRKFGKFVGGKFPCLLTKVNLNRKSIRRRKLANLASNSRLHSKNCLKLGNHASNSEICRELFASRQTTFPGGKLSSQNSDRPFRGRGSQKGQGFSTHTSESNGGSIEEENTDCERTRSIGKTHTMAGLISIMMTSAENFRGVRLGPIDRGPQRSGERESVCGQMSDRSKDGEGEKPRVSEQKGSMQPQVT